MVQELKEWELEEWKLMDWELVEQKFRIGVNGVGITRMRINGINEMVISV